MKLGKISLAALVLLSVPIFGGADAKAEILAASSNGWLNIENYVDSIYGDDCSAVHYDDSGVSDGKDSWDILWIDPMPGESSLYLDIGTHKLKWDYRQPSSIADFYIKLVYNGTLSEAKNNYLEFSLPYGSEWEFGDKPILFQSDLLPYGPVIDVRKAIAENSGIVPLEDLPAGTYSPSTPYGSGILTIGTRLLADLDDSNQVNFEDFAIWAEDWQKGPGQYVGDICGPNGIPDSNVDSYDLMAFGEDWLKDVNAPNTW